jgi:copper chaperone CopZ
MNDTTLQVTGMSCGGCAGRVTRTLRELEGVHEVEIELSHGTVRIRHAPELLASALAERVTAAGYPSRLA